MSDAQREPARRLFFALWPDEQMQRALADATRAAVAESHGTPVPTQNLHFTLAFLGSVAESRIPGLGAIAAQVAGSFRAGALPLIITLDRVQYWRRSQILCASATAESAEAAALAEALKAALTANGFAPDLKPFRAHATLARKVRRATRSLHMQSVRWSFCDFRLMESHTDPRGSVYSTREIFVLDALLH